jgi:hypothetical protein
VIDDAAHVGILVMDLDSVAMGHGLSLLLRGAA